MKAMRRTRDNARGVIYGMHSIVGSPQRQLQYPVARRQRASRQRSRERSGRVQGAQHDLVHAVAIGVEHVHRSVLVCTIQHAQRVPRERVVVPTPPRDGLVVLETFRNQRSSN